MMNTRITTILAALALFACAAHGFLVNDAFTDTDRIGGFDGSSTSSDPLVGPVIGTPTDVNTQWVVNGTSSMVASGSGLLWTMNNTSNRMGIGYFPNVAVGGTPVTLTLNFTTGTFGAAANNLRMAIFDASPNGLRTTDGFGSTDPSYVDDVGYGIFSGSSNVGGGSTTDLTLRTYGRATTISSNLLGTSGEWALIEGSTGATGYLAENTAYSLAVTLVENAGVLSITTALTGGNLSGFNYTALDSTSPVLNFNAFAMRWGGGQLQFSDFNLTSFTVAEVPEPSVYAALAGLLALGFVAWRRRT